MNDVVRVRVRPADDDGWRVAYETADGAQAAPPRTLRRAGRGGWSAPLPPVDEVERLPADAPHGALCRADDPSCLDDALADLVARRSGSVETMGRYLFAVLLGDAWSDLEGARRLELEWPATDAVFHRFSWEMLHDGEGFVALRDGIVLVRRVEGPEARTVAATTPLDVLFVVGGSLQDEALRPAAEYLGVLRSLRHRALDRRLRPRLVLDATADRLRAAIDAQRPAVVHFIAHGRHSSDRPFLEIRDSTGERPQPLFAEGLLELLRDSNGRPEDAGATSLPIVVLSACETTSASGGGGQITASFAAELISGGVPLAVGMSGPVGDLACRLFSRAFYRALLEGEDVATACAVGRRAAVAYGGYDARASNDWALPTLVASSRLEAARLQILDDPMARKFKALAEDIAITRFPTFCDRLGLLARGEMLLASAVTQRRMLGTERQFLSISTRTSRSSAWRHASDRGPGFDTIGASDAELYGRTWALHTLAANAALAGHVPCLISQTFPESSDDPVSSWSSFIERLQLTMDHWAVKFGVDSPVCSTLRFLTDDGPRPDDLPKELERRRRSGEARPLDLAFALRLDLLRWLERARALLPKERRADCRLLLLIDDLHLMGDLAADLVDSAFGGLFGFRQSRDAIRVVFSWTGGRVEYAPIEQRIVDWLGDPMIESVELGPFEGPEEWLAYRQALLHYREGGQSRGALRPQAPVVRTPRTEKLLDTFFRSLSRTIRGVPSRIPAAASVIDVYRLDLDEKVLRDAQDEDILELAVDGGGGH